MLSTISPNKALWQKGDFTRVAAFMRESGTAIAESLGASPSMHVLDLGCGDGTTALPLASHGARVTGVDIADNLVAAGTQRAADAGLTNLTFESGDACDLFNVPDHTFHLTLSMFGVMFAPKPFEVAAEMVRVTRPGGRIVMGNWIPNDETSFVSELLRIGSAYMPPPPEGFISPMTWGVASHITDRFGRAGIPAENISMVKSIYRFISRDQTPEQFIEIMENYYGPTMNALAAAQSSGHGEEFHAKIVELANVHNRCPHGGTNIPATFLRVTVNL